MPEHLEDELVGRNVSLAGTHTFPLPLDVCAVWMPFEQNVPEELIALTMETFPDDEHAIPQRDLTDRRVRQGSGPALQPISG